MVGILRVNAGTIRAKILLPFGGTRRRGSGHTDKIAIGAIDCLRSLSQVALTSAKGWRGSRLIPALKSWRGKDSMPGWYGG